MKKQILIIFAFLLVLTFVSAAGTVDVNFNKTSLGQGETLTVTYAANPTGFYFVKQFVPNGWTVVSPSSFGGAVTNNTLRFSLSSVQNVQFIAPIITGENIFSGQYLPSGDLVWSSFSNTSINVVAISTPVIKINEFFSHLTSGDWIELYNLGNNYDLSNCYLSDGDGSNLSLSGTLMSGDYSTFDWDGRLNRPGDEIELYCDGSLIDGVVYGVAAGNAPVPNENQSTGRWPNGADTEQDEVDFIIFTNITKGIANINSSVVNPPVIPSSSNSSDDLMVNYIRGKINVNGVAAGSGVNYVVEVLDGVNAGSNFTGNIDLMIPSPQLQGNGYFDTRDRVEFNTGARFRVSVGGYDNCTAEGNFMNGGNGWFEPEGNGLIVLNCFIPVPPTAPVLGYIDDQTINEDESSSIVVTATDLNNDVLSYNVINENVDEVDCIFGVNGNLSIVPAANWNGLASCMVEVSDGSLVDNQTFFIEVLSVNDAPVLEHVPDLVFNEGELINYTFNATDVDGDVLNYSAATSLTWNYTFYGDENGNFLVQTYYFQDRVYNFTVFVTDGELNDSQKFKVTLLNVNIAPTLGNITNQVINEDSGEYVVGQLNGHDKDGNKSLLVYEVIDENTNEVDCILNDDVLSINPAANWNGLASCSIRVLDDEGESSNVVSFNISVLPVNDNFSISGISPSNPVWVLVNNSQDFSVSINENVDENNFSYNWFFDDVFNFTGLTNNWNRFFGLVGDYDVLVNVTDGEFSDSSNWDVRVRYREDLSCSQANANLCSSNQICNGDLWNGTDGSCCSIPCNAAPPSFNDAKQCALQSSDLKLNIKEPDNGDDFTPGEDIEVELEIENKFNEDKDVEIYVYLYDTDEDKDLEKEKESLDIDEDDKEEVELTLSSSNDLDDGNEHYVYVYVEDEDNESICVSDYVRVDFEREDDDVIIEDYRLSLDNAKCQDKVFADLEIRNIGSDDQDVYVELISSELGLDLITPEFELEEYNEDDDADVSFEFTIPINVSAGTYDIQANVYYSDDKTTEILSLTIGECRTVNVASGVIDLTPTNTIPITIPRSRTIRTVPIPSSKQRIISSQSSSTWWDDFVDWFNGYTYFNTKSNKRTIVVQQNQGLVSQPVAAEPEQQIIIVERPAPAPVQVVQPQKIVINNNVKVNVDVEVKDNDVQKTIIVKTNEAKVVKTKDVCLNKGTCMSKRTFYYVLDGVLVLGILIFFIILIARALRR
jgi:hypothetical protein